MKERLRKIDLAALSCLVIITLIAFYNTLDFEFIHSLDDDWLLTDNPAIKNFTFNGIKHLFLYDKTDMHYHPVTYLSYSIDFHFWGLSKQAFRLHNIVLHAINGALIYYFIFRISVNRWLAFVAALCFLIHPMNADSIIWLSCRRQSLFLLFFLLSVISFHNYIRASVSNQSSSAIWFATSYTFWLFSTMSKASGIVLPGIWFLLWYLQNGGFKSFSYYVKVLVLCSVPMIFFIYKNGLAAGENFLVKEFNYDAIQHVFFTSYSYTFYIIRWLWPFDLAVFYPSPSELKQELPFYFHFSLFVAIIVLYGIYYHIKMKERLPAFLLMSYTIAILPTLDLILIYSDLPMLVSNRYFYMPGIFIIVYAFYLFNRLIKNRMISISFQISLMLVFLLSFIKYSSTWKDSISLLENTTKCYPNEEMLYRLAIEYYSSGDTERAVKTLNSADNLKMGIWINNPAEFYWKRSIVYLEAGDTSKAQYDLMLALDKSIMSERDLYLATEKIIFSKDDYELCKELTLLHLSLKDMKKLSFLKFLDKNQIDYYRSCIQLSK